MSNTHYLAFLRAINVGGRVVKMERLRALFHDLGFANVRTYIQSGNVYFESTIEDRAELSSTIELYLLQKLGFAVPIALRTVDEVRQAVELAPFAGLDVTSDMRLCIAFVAGPLPADIALPHWSPKRDVQIVALSERDIFAIGYILDGKPGNLGAYLEKTFGLVATVRFYHTTQKLLDWVG